MKSGVADGRRLAIFEDLGLTVNGLVVSGCIFSVNFKLRKSKELGGLSLYCE